LKKSRGNLKLVEKHLSTAKYLKIFEKIENYFQENKKGKMQQKIV